MADGWNATTLDVPQTREVEFALRDMRAMYLRTLASWAGDALSLRRSGDHDAVWSPTAFADAA